MSKHFSFLFSQFEKEDVLKEIQNLDMIKASQLYSQEKTCVLLNSVQNVIEMQGWLLLSFFTCLHNQLSSFNFIIV